MKNISSCGLDLRQNAITSLLPVAIRNSSRIARTQEAMNMAKPTTISEINAKYSYTDENPGGKRDASLVSCAQCDDYNELQYIYDKKLLPLVNAGTITKQGAIDALSESCAELANPRTRVKFYALLTKKLGHTIG